ncbi:sperm-associated antigen 5 [Parambassis ranga]|uniref:Sperm-associated antigen 5 n=1 Tax=Parambassis ranga TaxID=210632 RepID=A0A6P7JAS7_9TELE|nr:sperm-associated antigen 5 [Parambassis ranga]
MTSRKSGSSGKCLHMPLRSLENEILPLSSPTSRFKSKSQISADTLTKGGNPLSDPEPQTAGGLGDVTFKSFICAGGEVEILGSSLCAEETVVLPKDQPTYYYKTEDTISSHSEVHFCDHMEHPYHLPEMKDPDAVDLTAACEVSNTALVSIDINGKQITQDPRAYQEDCSGAEHVTWKSFVCDGVEVEVSDATKLKDETIPLPKAEHSEPLQDNSVNSTVHSDSGELCEVEHADHPYCSSGNVPVIATSDSKMANDPEKSVPGLSDVTFKPFNCTGGEIELSEDTRLPDETVPLPTNNTLTNSDSIWYHVGQSMLAGDHDLENDDSHLDHPYCNILSYPSPSHGSLSTQESLQCSAENEEVKKISSVVADCKDGGQEGDTFSSVITAGEGVRKSEDNWRTLPEDKVISSQPRDKNNVSTLDDKGNPNCYLENSVDVVDTDPHRTKISDSSLVAVSPESPAPVEAQQYLEYVSQVNSIRGTPEASSEAKDSAIGSSENGPVLCNSAERPLAKHLSDVVNILSESSPLALLSHLGISSPIVRRASLLKAHGDPAEDQFLADDSAFEGEKSLLAPGNVSPAGLWADHLESPMPRPLFNSTALGYKAQSVLVKDPVENLGENVCAAPQSQVEKPVLDIPLIPDGPLQQQLRQMAEFLIFASGKMGPSVCASAPPSTAFKAPSAPAESHSVCVGTSPLKLVDHSLNTSGLFERKREFSVVDSCTLTDPLLWNLPPGSLESLPRHELEQRLRSSMIMTEALVQQLAAARAQGSSSTGPAPSELREKLVQTDHTELSQTTMYRDLYMGALSRIGELELSGSSLQNLMQYMQGTRVTMTSLRCDVDAALGKMKEMGDVVREDHQSLVSHYGHMKSVFEKSKETQTRAMQKVKEALHQRNNMRTQMEEALTAKEAVLRAMEELRTHCASEISALERSAGSQQELLAALQQTYPEQVVANKAYTETLKSASDLLSQTMEEQSSLTRELFTVRNLLEKTAPILLKLNEKAAAALRERDEHISARDQAIQEREQTEEELNETHSNLQTAREQIRDLNLQVTILTSEMGVIRQKLTEKTEETGQLERKVTELSATVSSTLASHTFLEQALAAETSKLQQSWKEAEQANERANELEASLEESEQHVSELTEALALSEEQVSQLHTLSQSQSLEIQHLQDVCRQLGGVREMNEFLQTENELAREQVAESERMLKTNLQALRERNIQCEDLKTEVCHLQSENRTLQEELESTQSRASETQLEFGEKMAEAVTEVTLLHHTLRGLTNDLHAALGEQKPQSQMDQPVDDVNRQHFSSSFVGSIMVALAAEKEEDVRTDTPDGSVPSDTPDPQCDTLFSETSAFTRITAITPKKDLNGAESDSDVEEQKGVAEMLADLSGTVTELVSTLKMVQQLKESQREELHKTICALQVEHQAANNRHEAEVFELKHQLNRMSNLVERGNQALQQKAEDEKTVSMLMAEVKEAQEFLNKLKADNNELRKEVFELRRALQQSTTESQFLREELRKAGGHSANPAHFMDEKIQLLREVERLKASLQELEHARAKLLERAKRHQMIHQSNQQKSENELQILNHMINKVRETLLSLPDVVKNCEQLQQLIEYIG